MLPTGINSAIRGTDSGALIITHYSRILDHVKPDKIHVLIDGKIVATGDASLANDLEENGYDWLENKIRIMEMKEVTTSEARDVVGDYKAGWHDPENPTIRFDAGLSEQVVRDISELKNEPEWMTEMRVKAFKHFDERPMPTWGNMSMLNDIDFDKYAIIYVLQRQQRMIGMKFQKK